MAKVSVPQRDGEIVIARAGDEPKTYKVTDGTVTVAADDLEHFLAHVDGSKPEGGQSSSTKKEG